MSQIATPSSKYGGRRKLPYVFTEQGVAMLAGVLRSETAVKMSIQIINAFVVMRKFIINNAPLFLPRNRYCLKKEKTAKHEIRKDEKFEKVFNALQSKIWSQKQGIFMTDKYSTLIICFRSYTQSRKIQFI